MMKICTKCKKCKSLQDFKKRTGSQRLRSWCRDCERRLSRANSREYYKKYSQTPHGKAAIAWANINQRAMNKRGIYPSYATVELLITREEFMEWAVPEFAKWMNDNPGETPSISRPGDVGHYVLGNLEIISARENAKLRRQNKNVHAAPGEAWCGLCRAYKPNSAFSKTAGNYNGLDSRCKACQRREHRKRKAQLVR